MTRSLAACAVALALGCTGAGAARAQGLLPANEWIELSAPPAKSTLEGLSAAGAGYHALARIPVTPGGAYTLLAESADRKPLLVMVRGHDPREAQQPQPPSGAGTATTINTGGGTTGRVDFRVDPRSAGNAAWVVFSSSEPGRRVRLLLKSPGDADPATKVGGVSSLPVYVAGRGETAAAPIAGGAGPFAFNQWVQIKAPAERTLLPAYSGFGPLYHTVVPIRLEKGGRYTLFAEWDDGMAMLFEARGHDPGTNPPSIPSGAVAAATLNISGGHAWRINFVVDPRSRGGTAWLVFPSRQPGRTLRVMLKSPGDPDALTGAPVMGAYVGSVSRSPLYLAEDGRD